MKHAVNSSTPLGSTKIKRQFSTENCRFILGFGLKGQPRTGIYSVYFRLLPQPNVTEQVVICHL